MLVKWFENACPNACLGTKVLDSNFSSCIKVHVVFKVIKVLDMSLSRYYKVLVKCFGTLVQVPSGPQVLVKCFCRYHIWKESNFAVFEEGCTSQMNFFMKEA